MYVDVLIIGGGLSGVTTAHRLAKRGCSIALVESNTEVGIGANFANGAMLVPSQAAPFNSPGIFLTFLKALITQDSWLRIKPKALPSLFKWGFHFIINSKAQLHEQNMRSLFDLGRYSMNVFEEYYKKYADKFDARKCGTIKIFRDRSSLEAQINSNRYLSEYFGLKSEILTPDQTVMIEPHLSGIYSKLAGGIFFPNDMVADSHRYCKILSNELIKGGQTVHVGCQAIELLMSGDRVAGARTTTGDIRAKNTILAIGSEIAKLAPRVARSILVQPVKGYSLTYETGASNNLPSYPVVDEGKHVAVVPISGKLRTVGFAEFAQYDDTLNTGIVSQLNRFTKSVYPNLVETINNSKQLPWIGFRAISADGLPYIGETSSKGLWINTGHGHLGWTLAAGCAEILADLITGSATELESSKFAIFRSNKVSSLNTRR